MGILNRLCDQNEWLSYLNYKIEQGNISQKDAEDLYDFISRREYTDTVSNIINGGNFSYPKKTLISKSNVNKKRAVYTFSREENYVLKLLAYLLREYDNVFAPNLYSFRKERGVKRATKDILKIKELSNHYVYKVDISNYFNSVVISILELKLREILADDPDLYEFFIRLLKTPYVYFNGEIIEEDKGIMAGVPISTFLANIYLSNLDFHFHDNHIPYMRYSDDIITFSKSEHELNSSITIIKETLKAHKLEVNKEKEYIYKPNEEWTFLGFSYHNGTIDISSTSFEKIKAKMRRKTRALKRWADSKGVPKEKAAKVFIKRFNAKLYDNPIHNELTWARWFFPVINTDKTLKSLDSYMLECIRYLATGKRTKAKYNFKYEKIKELGFRSLVNEYYKLKNEKI